MSRGLVIVGATSAIAEATARLFATGGARLYLVARDANKLAAVAQDLRLRGAASVDVQLMDANDLQMHEAMLERAAEVLGRLDIILVAHGTLPDQGRCEAAVHDTIEALNTNFVSVVSLLTHAANRLAAQGMGTIVVISSVAGDRGRQSNYVYGTAKGAVSIFLQGLRNRLHKDGVHVLTVKPGFVDSPMTASFKKGTLWATPQSVAEGIQDAIERRRDVVYLPWFWRWIMLIIRAIPEGVFKRTRL